LDISWDEAHGIMGRAVARGLARREHKVPEYIGLDEKALARGQRYATIACDLDDGHVIDVAPERTSESVVRCLGRFSLNDLEGIKAVAMDMCALRRKQGQRDLRDGARARREARSWDARHDPELRAS
jgi:transposase